MRPCPTCGGLLRREVAPGFFQCLTPRSRGRLAKETTDPDVVPLCEVRYLDTSQR
jgi:hypothetical protein